MGKKIFPFREQTSPKDTSAHKSKQEFQITVSHLNNFGKLCRPWSDAA